MGNGIQLWLGASQVGTSLEHLAHSLVVLHTAGSESGAGHDIYTHGGWVHHSVPTSFLVWTSALRNLLSCWHSLLSGITPVVVKDTRSGLVFPVVKEMGSGLATSSVSSKTPVSFGL